MKKVFEILSYLVSMILFLLGISMIAFGDIILLPISVSLILFGTCNLPIIYNRYLPKMGKLSIFVESNLNKTGPTMITSAIKKFFKKLGLFAICIIMGLSVNIIFTIVGSGIDKITDEKAISNKSYEIKEGVMHNYKDTKFYEYGDVLIERFNSLGIQDAESVKIKKIEPSSVTSETIEADIELVVSTKKESIYVHLIRHRGEWDTTVVKSHEKNYYLRGNYVDVENTIVKNDIYSYTTGEIIEKKDEVKINAYYEEQKQVRKDRERADFFNMEADYIENPIVAKETHEGSNFIIEGTISNAQGFDYGEGLDEYNSILLDISIEHFDGSIHVVCAFDYSMKEELSKYKIGDKIIIFGECVDSRYFRNCNITEY